MAQEELTPRQVWERSVWYGMQGDIEAQLALYAPDCVIEFPFVADPVPHRFTGREEIRDMIVRLRAATPAAENQPVESESTVVVHETSDPEVIIPEFTVALANSGTGEVVKSSYVQVIRVRDGLISSIRDYFSPATVEDVRRALA